MFHRRFLRLPVAVPVLVEEVPLLVPDVRLRVSVFLRVDRLEDFPSSGSGVGVALADDIGDASRFSVRLFLAGGGDGDDALNSASSSCRCSDINCSYSSNGRVNSCNSCSSSASPSTSSSFDQHEYPSFFYSTLSW